MRVNKVSRSKCKKCKSQSLRKEPAGISCVICGWFKHFKNVSPNNLWRQYILNKQYFSPTLMIQLLGIYRVNRIISGKDCSLTEDDQRVFEAKQRLYSDTLAHHVNAPKKFIKEQLS